MVTVIAETTVSENELEHVKPLYQEVAAYTRNQPGCMLYQIYHNMEKPGSIVFIEQWAGEKELDAHLNDPVFLKMYRNIEDCFTEDERVNQYELFVG